MQFGLSTHLFHGERLGKKPLQAIAQHGFEFVEIFATQTHFDYHDRREIAELGRLLADLGLQAGSMHAPICAGYTHGDWGRAFSNATGSTALRREAVAETAAAFDAAAELGCDTMVLHLGLPRTQPVPADDNDLHALRRSLEDLAPIAAASPVRLALEIIPNDLSTPDALLQFLDGELALGSAGVCLDIGHAHLMGGAPEAAEALSGHVIATHVHDNRGVEDSHLVPFEGTVDWPASLSAIWKIGYSGRLTFEVADHGDPLGVLARTARARTRLQAILDQLTLPISFDDV